MKPIRFALSRLCLAALFACPSLTHAQTGFFEDFDGVTAPALPSGWTSVSLIGTQTAITSAANFYSAPNAAYLPNPDTTSDTALVSPELSFSTGTPKHRLHITFKHKRGMETNWDGGVLEVSINGGAFVDVTNASIGGVFTAGDYNCPGLFGGNPLASRPAWTGTSASFEQVAIHIPEMPSDTPFRFRFRLGTDALFGAPGWYIDNITLSPVIDAQVQIIPGVSQVKAGNLLPFTVRVLNPGSVALEPGVLFIAAASGDAIQSMTIASGYIQRMTDSAAILHLMYPIAPFGSQELTVNVRTSNPPRGGAILTIKEAFLSEYVGASGGLAFLSSSPALPAGGFQNVPFLYFPVNFCDPLPDPLPPAFAGSLVLGTVGPGCTVGEAALKAQGGGAIGFIAMSSVPPPPPPGTGYTHYVEEAPTPGLSIPAFTFEYQSFLASLAPGLFSGPPGTCLVSVPGLNQPVRGTSVLTAARVGVEDPKPHNNIAAAFAYTATDKDNDGTPDYLDACPNDPAKTSPGACGCGAADTDANSNGVADCRVTEDFRAEVLALRKAITQLKLANWNKQKALRSKAKKLQKTIVARAGQGGIAVSSASVNLPKVAKKLKAPVARLTRSTSQFDANKKAALQAIKALLKGLAV